MKDSIMLKIVIVLLALIIAVLSKNGTIFDGRDVSVSMTGSGVNESVSEKKALIALLLALFVPIPGIQSFYAGRIGKGIAQLLTLNFLGIGWVWDVIMICMGKFRDSTGKVMKF